MIRLAGYALGACVALALADSLPTGVAAEAQHNGRGGSVVAPSNGDSVAGPPIRSFVVRTSAARPYNDPRQALKNAEIAVSDAVNGVVNIYLENAPHTMVGQLTGFSEPQGLAVDGSNNLYVANTRGHDILVFAPGASLPFRRLNDSGNLPVGVAVDTDGTVYVTNINPGKRPAGIVVYPKGATEPTTTLTDPSIANDYFVAVGANHHVYTTYFDQNGVAQIGQFFYRDPHLYNLNIANYQFPGGIKADDRFVLAIDQNARALLVFDPPHRYPRSFVPFGPDDPVSFDYGKTERSVWVANGSTGAAEHYAWSGRRIDAISIGGQPLGVVTLPKRTK